MFVLKIPFFQGCVFVFAQTNGSREHPFAANENAIK